MEKKEITSLNSNTNPFVSSFTFLLITLIGFLVVGPALGAGVISLFYEGSMEELMNAMSNPLSEPSIKNLLLINQGIASSIGLIVIPYLYLKFIDRQPFGVLGFTWSKTPALILLLPVVMVASMGVNSLVVEWNAGMSFPESMANTERVFKELEDRAAELTQMMTSFDNLGGLLFGLLIIAVIPAIGEEIVFRGYLQKQLSAGFNNIHVGIWISAFLFSAIHLQFYGFFPRMLLGALFGYLMVWSGSIWAAIIAHFINNGLQLVLLYLVSKGTIDLDVDSTDALPWYQVLTFGLLLMVVLYYFRKLSSSKLDDNYG